MLNPNTTMCVAKFKGKEVGRVAATAANASQYLQELASAYGELEVDYVEDQHTAMVDRMIRGSRSVPCPDNAGRSPGRTRLRCTSLLSRFSVFLVED